MIDSALKCSVILVTALALMPLLRHHSAAMRHWVLAAALACAAVTPALTLAAPSWSLPWPAAAFDRSVAPPTADSREASAHSGDVEVTAAAESVTAVPRPRRSASDVAAAIWLAGTVLCGLVLLAGLGRLTWLTWTARPITSGAWFEQTERLRFEQRLRPIHLRETGHPRLLVTWGVFRPTLLIPTAARHWPPERVGVVLRHELAHIRRADWAVQLASELVRTAWWCNPLVWIACRRLREECERACDDTVVNEGIDGAEYATHLIELARTLTSTAGPWSPAPAIAHPSGLERRIIAMLNTQTNRTALSRRGRAAIVLAALSVAMAIAGFGAAAQTFATVSGSITDPSRAVLPGVTVVLTNAQSGAKHEVRSDRAGRFEFVGLPPADYAMEAMLPGFSNLRRTLTIVGQDVQQDLSMQIGSLQETITVDDSDGPVRRRGGGIPRPLPQCRSTPAAAGNGVPIGGNVRPPVKILDVAPRFPDNLRGTGTRGLVSLEALIGTDGLVNDVRVIGDAHPDLASAATEAVRQWQFDSTLLNCEAVEVTMKVSVHFVPKS